MHIAVQLMYNKYINKEGNMKRVVILEGPDNIGKSTLCEVLKKLLPTAKVRHFGPPRSRGQFALAEQLHTLHTEINEIEDEKNTDLEIWDRSILGESVYGPLYRFDQYNTREYYDALVQRLNRTVANQIFVVVFYTDGEIYERLGIKSKADETVLYQKQSEAAKISTAFVDLVSDLELKHRLFINCANYASFKDRNAYIIRRIRTWIRRKKYEHQMTDDYSQTFFNPKQMIWVRGLGFKSPKYLCGMFTDKSCQVGLDHKKYAEFGMNHRRPTYACGAKSYINYIFVGEAPGHKGCGKLGIPFYGDRSGNLLQDALDRLGIAPTQYYMTNTVKCCPKDNDLGKYGKKEKLECAQSLKNEIKDVLLHNTNCRVVALGKVAAKSLADAKIEHVMAYHPAYYLRTGNREQFVIDLKKVLGESL